MPKAAPQDVKDLGFSYEMFQPVISSDSGLDGLIAEIIEDNVPEVKDAIGASAYDDAANKRDVVRIEKYLAACELWERKRNIVLQNRPVGGDGSALLNMTESITAEEYKDKAWKLIERVRGRAGMAFSSELSSHFPQDSE